MTLGRGSGVLRSAFCVSPTQAQFQPPDRRFARLMWAYRLEVLSPSPRHDIPEPSKDDVPEGSVVLRGGTVIYFGNPDDRSYPLDFGRMMDKDVILHAGRTPQTVRRQAMIRSQAYAERYPGMMKSYVTHVLPLDRMQEAYELAARPAVGRVKVVLSGRTQNAER